MVRIPGLRPKQKAPSSAETIERLDSIMLDLKVETNMTGRKLERMQRQAQSLIQKGVGAPKQQKMIYAAEAKALGTQAATLKRKLMRDLTVYNFATTMKGAYEAQEIMDDGPLRALQDLMQVNNLNELQGKMQALAKQGYGLDMRLQDAQKRLEDMQEEFDSMLELEDDQLMGLMEDLEKLPPTEVEGTLQKRVRFDIDA